MSPPQRLATLDYLAEVAKDWVVSTFAAAADSDFAFEPHRFEFDGFTVRRRRLPRRSRQAADPLQLLGRTRKPIAFARTDIATLLADCESGPVAYQQEIVEIFALDEDEVLADAAPVVRIPGLPPCLGRFGTVG